MCQFFKALQVDHLLDNPPMLPLNYWKSPRHVRHRSYLVTKSLLEVGDKSWLIDLGISHRMKNHSLLEALGCSFRDNISWMRNKDILFQLIAYLQIEGAARLILSEPGMMTCFFLHSEYTHQQTECKYWKGVLDKAIALPTRLHQRFPSPSPMTNGGSRI